jgi:hypothetical protein
MNRERLKQAEAAFMRRYPGGFANPEMQELSRKHKMDTMVELARTSFAREQFGRPEIIVDQMLKLISRSSMISVFEKPKFRDFVTTLSAAERRLLVLSLETLLHGSEQDGFERLLAILQTGKLGRWPLMTICQTYYNPQVAVFIKPTTTKWVIEYFELSPLCYHATPSWAFYRDYSQAIHEMKNLVDATLSPSNAAFTGFLMMSMESRG